MFGYRPLLKGGGSTTFKDLTDTPTDYTGQAGKMLVVNTAEDGLDFIDAPAGGGFGSLALAVEISTANYDI